MSTIPEARRTTEAQKQHSGIVRLLAILVMVGGAILSVGGATTWGVVQTSLADEKITVAEDAARFAGQPVDGPLTAYAEADIIKHHSLEASQGKTYAELDREDPVRTVVMNGSFLRASLFTSVVSFGVAAMATGLGVLFFLVGFALLKITPKTAAE
ncbi:MAG: aromatic ring-opening dioxygenase LigA [Actinomycetes bacterium]